jgi:outer membrane protein assembly factor BamB
LTFFMALSVLSLIAADWTRFRGPEGSGISDDKNVPTQWSDTQNIRWKTALPGPGSSSPITLGDKIFLTCYSGYGLSEDKPGEQAELKHHVLCLDRRDGKLVWDQATKADVPEQAYESYVALHGYASASPATDGQAVYAFFGRSGVYAYSLDGKLLWHTLVGTELHNWGSGASPIVHGDLLIVNASVESKSVVALDKRTGKEVWRVDDVGESWSTPLVVQAPDGGQELVINMRARVLAVDPATGKELWHCTGIKSYVCPSVVAQDGIVYISGGRPPESLAVRAGGRGDVTKSHVLWTRKKTTLVGTPVVHDGYLYWIAREGIAACAKADSGKMVYEKRLDLEGEGDKVYASLVLADGKLYGVSRQDGTVVLAVGPEFKQLAHNRLGDASVFDATPVVSQGDLLLRSNQFLYCIGK